MIGFEILNLDFRKDRRDVLIGNFLTQKIPYEQATFHKAVYGADYADGDEIRQAAAVDGFLELLNFGGERGDVAYHWGLLRILRYIASSEYPYPFGYFNQDDRLLLMKYTEILSACETLSQLSETFMFLQLGWFLEPEYDIVKPPEHPIEGTPYNKGVLGSGDSGLLMSQAGAQLLLDTFKETSEWFEVIPYRLKDLPGVYSMSEPDTTISMIDTRWWGIEDSEADQDRILVNAL